MTIDDLPDDTHMGCVRLRVADLERSLGFYRERLGLTVADRTGEGAALAPPDAVSPLIVLVEDREARPRPPRSTGLFHLALLVPDRAALARMLLRLHGSGWPLQGLSDHAVSEAIYLADPEGNGIEIYADRPREQWSYENGEIHMTTAPLDVEALLRAADEAGAGAEDGLPAGTRVGHIHLSVSDLEPVEAFYHDLFGFDVVTRAYPGALFLAAGGYHHHIGANTWAGKGAPRPPADAAGLIDYEIVVPDAAAVERLQERVRAHGAETTPVDAGWRVEDPDGIGVVVRRESS